MRHLSLDNRCVRYARVACAVAAALWSASASAQGARVLRGVVVDSLSKARVQDVEVFIDGVSRTHSSPTGQFIVPGLTPGEHAIVLRRIGFTPLAATIPARESDTLTFAFRLVATETTLPTVGITAEDRLRALKLSGFDERRAAGLGKFLTADDFRARPNATLRDILDSDVPGIYIEPRSGLAASRRGGPVTFASGRGAGPCYLSVRLDGARIDSTGLDKFQVSDIAGIEVYRGASEIPLQYSGTGSNCGVLLIWTGRR